MRLVCVGFALALWLTTFGCGKWARAAAEEPYEGYGYDAWNSPVAMPPSHTVEGSYNGIRLGCGELNHPEDLFYRSPFLYVLDSGNGRVVVLDEDTLQCVRVIDEFLWNGEPYFLNQPQGIFVRESGELLICDTENRRVILSDPSGKIMETLDSPDAASFPAGIDFLPVSVLEDQAGSIYVLVRDFYYGALAYNADGEFETFFGANQVTVTAALLSDLFWKNLLSDKQLSYMSNYNPIPYTGFDIDSEDFIYTVTQDPNNSTEEIKKLNKQGTDILLPSIGYDVIDRSDYGDKERTYYQQRLIDTAFVDIDISDEDVISALDYTGGKVFQYDQDSNLLFIFGGMGENQGLFLQPAALETIGRRIIVLDREKNDITVFAPNQFGNAVLDAQELYKRGLYQEAETIWRDVLKQNSNYQLAYIGIGRSLLQQKQYEESLWYFQKGYDRENYSTAFNYVRGEFVKQNFIWFALAVLVLVAWVFLGRTIIGKIRAIRGTGSRDPSEETPMYVATHLMNGFEPIRRTNRFSLLVCAVLINALWFFAAVFQRQLTGFIFNLNRLEYLNLGMVLLQTVGVMLLFCVCNWGVTTLIDGEGNLRRIFISVSYAIFPYVISLLIKTAVSCVAIYEEGALLEVITGAGLIWSAYLVWNAVKEVHQFTVWKTFISLVLTIFGMMVVLFVILLFFALSQQLITFIQTIFNEVMFRTV